LSWLRVVPLLLLALGGVGSALRAQGRHEVQVQAVATATAEQYIGGGVGYAYRTVGRVRLGLLVSAGSWEGDPAGRAEGLVSYHLSPFRRRGVTPYAGGGATVTFTDAESSEVILLVVGVESRPGGRRGWFVEAGLAGGLRLAAGLRWRFGSRSP
jgi:hypothetical protein